MPSTFGSCRKKVSQTLLPDRTASGRRYLRPCLQSHLPLDLIVIMLGNNDLKVRFHKPASEVAMGMGVLIHDIKEIAAGPGGRVPEIMIVAPPPILPDLGEWGGIFAGARPRHGLGPMRRAPCLTCALPRPAAFASRTGSTG